MDVLGLTSARCPSRGPLRHPSNLEHPQGVGNLGTKVTHETSWVPAYTLKVLLRQHPALPCGSGVVLPYQHHHDSVQKGAACTHRETNPQ